MADHLHTIDRWDEATGENHRADCRRQRLPGRAGDLPRGGEALADHRAHQAPIKLCVRGQCRIVQGALMGDLGVKRLRAVVPRGTRYAIASRRAAQIALQFRPAVPSRGNRGSVVFLGEAQRSAAVGGHAPICPVSLLSCLLPFSQVFRVGPQGSRQAYRRQTCRVRSAAFRTRPIVKMLSLSSSMAAHPARPKLTGTDTEMSATRAQARIDNLAVGFVAAGPLVCPSRQSEDGTVWLPRR